MKKYVLSLLSMFALSLLVATPSNSDMRFGIMGSIGELETSGTEAEESGDVGDDSNSDSFTESFAAASLFAEVDLGDLLVVGFDYMPLGKELGSGKRTDATADKNESTDDTGTYSASAEAENLMSVYAHLNLGSSGLYGLIGYQEVDVSTTETLPNSTYGDVDGLQGTKIGIGIKNDNFRVEIAHSDFDDISLNSTSGSSKITADMDATYINLGYNF